MNIDPGGGWRELETIISINPVLHFFKTWLCSCEVFLRSVIYPMDYNNNNKKNNDLEFCNTLSSTDTQISNIKLYIKH